MPIDTWLGCAYRIGHRECLKPDADGKRPFKIPPDIEYPCSLIQGSLMVKAELLTRVVALNDNLSEGTCRLVVDTFFDALSKQLESGGRIELRGFGSIFVMTNEHVDRRNPRTGAAVTVARTCRVRFRPARQITKLLNSDI